MQQSECRACGAAALAPQARVSGDAGPEGMIPTTRRFGVALADIVRCSRCGHGQLERMPSEAELDRAYRDAASPDYEAEETGQVRTAAAVLDRIERWRSPSAGRAELLDLGCWLGYFAATAARRGWRPLGVEPSEFAAAHARQLGVEVIETPIERLELAASRFAVCFLGDVVEHLPDPLSQLRRIAAWLEPGGVVAMALPDAGSRVARLLGRRWWSIIPTHLQYFTRASMAALLDRAGYRLLELGTAPKSFSVDYYASRLGGYHPSAGRLARRAVRAAGLAERQWAPDFGDRMLVIARTGAR